MLAVSHRYNNKGASAPIFLDDKKMNYPKMLYKGNQEKYQTVIADDEDHESKLVEQGWCEYGELPECNHFASGSVGADPIPDSALIPAEQFDTLAEKLAATEDQLATSQGEFIAFQNDVAAMKARIAELQGVDGSTIGESKDAAPVDLNALNLEQLQALLDEKEIKYLKRDSKATLIELLNTQM